ncbi:MAG: hypothetical protein IJZ36_05135, partial [Bacilli bacterium]|nr:hypothetical protein [Bacilli bacterium]
KPSFNNDTLLLVSNELKDSISQYIDKKLANLSFINMNLEDKKVIIDTMLSNNYFNDYSLTKYKFNNFDFIINEKSNYKVDFIYNDNEVNYDITLNLVLEYETKIEKKDVTYQVIEEYRFNFMQNELKNLENNFYKFN